MEFYAPAVIKLLGEHAVVYGKPFVGVTINLFAKAIVGGTKNNSELVITLKDFGKTFSLGDVPLRKLFNVYKKRKGINTFLATETGFDPMILPYAVIASRMLDECGAVFFGKDIVITSTIPMQSGCASSAACATAFATALASLCKSKPSDEAIIDIARDGERITHRNDGAGKVDVTTSYYGGVVSYSQKNGIVVEKVKKSPNLVVINTGPKKSTAETVGHVAELYKTQNERTVKILDGIERCTLAGLEELKKGDMKALGREMLNDHELLKSLDLSTEGLDRAVSLSVANGAYGAKLSGGGGGGIAIAIAPDAKRIITAAERSGFKAFGANITEKGAKSALS